ncbi:hypothetical protein PIB30_030461 [Stylosanthes scabra]|uniref:Uncharacterized protein n=1 Tax=Stylosanthes scabra TaxID=79078 RepID=A0ABU6TBB6_9FABA|nr:hypothetical protein [Stylosanthes scabra]
MFSLLLCLLKPSRILAAASLLHTTPRRVAVPFTTKLSSPLLRPSVCSWPLRASAPRQSFHIQLRRIHSPAMATLNLKRGQITPQEESIILEVGKQFTLAQFYCNASLGLQERAAVSTVSGPDRREKRYQLGGEDHKDYVWLKACLMCWNTALS